MSAGSAMAAASDGRCFLCGRSAGVVAWRENGYAAVACHCGLAFVQPTPPQSAVDPRYDAHSAAFYRLPARQKVHWLLRHRAPGTLLEIGCGDGWFLDAARRAGFATRGLDADEARAATARRRGHEVRHGLLEELDTDERFDVVFHCDLLSHFPEPIDALRRMSALTAPGGVLFFEVGLLGPTMRAWYPHIGGIGLPQHRWLYSEGALAALVERAGLRVLATKRFGLGPSVIAAASLRRVARSARRLIRGPQPASQPATAAAPAPPPGAWRTRLSALGERFDNFVRYDVGAWAPALGPATLLVIARPEPQR
jgi:SAM-dependent methyltransferase